jgi:acylglycerol lipase
VPITHIEGTLTGKYGTRLYHQGWVPSGNPRAIIILVHGLADHSGRYHNLVNAMVPAGYAIYAIDLRGHGKSEGKRCCIKRFDDYIEDLDAFVNIIGSTIPRPAVFMAGHSMGGVVATAYAQAHQNKLSGLILSAPALKAGASITKIQKQMAKVLSVLAPDMGVAKLDANGLSRDAEVVRAYIEDPLVYTGKVSARLGAEILKAIEGSIPPKMKDIKLPVLIMHGTSDVLSDPQGSKMAYESISSTDKSLKYFHGFFHEIFNDPERRLVFADMREWLANHS